MAVNVDDRARSTWVVFECVSSLRTGILDEEDGFLESILRCCSSCFCWCSISSLTLWWHRADFSTTWFILISPFSRVLNISSQVMTLSISTRIGASFLASPSSFKVNLFNSFSILLMSWSILTTITLVMVECLWRREYVVRVYNYSKVDEKRLTWEGCLLFMFSLCQTKNNNIECLRQGNNNGFLGLSFLEEKTTGGAFFSFLREMFIWLMWVIAMSLLLWLHCHWFSCVSSWTDDYCFLWSLELFWCVSYPPFSATLFLQQRENLGTELSVFVQPWSSASPALPINCYWYILLLQLIYWLT